MSPEALRIATTAACALSGALLLHRRSATATAWFLLACALTLPLARRPETSSAAVFTLSLAVSDLAPVLAVVAGLFWPVRRVSGVDRAIAVIGIFIAVGLNGIVPALVYDPRAAGCNRCSTNLLEIGSAPALGASLQRLAAVLTVGWSVIVAFVLIGRWAHAPRLAQRHSWPLLLGAASIAVLAATRAVRELATPPGVYDSLGARVWFADLGLLLLMSAGTWWRLSLPRRVGNQVARAALTAAEAPTALVDSLARAVGEPELAVTYNRLGGERVDVDGRPAPAPVGKAALRLTRDGTAYAEIWYGGLPPRSTADLVDAVATSCGPALEYFAAQARLRAETRDAITARKQLVIMADAERRRLERDLHDGAQQGLITLSMQLTAAAASCDPAGRQRLHTAQQEITEALQGLREIARGLFPVSLAEAGIMAALRELGDHTPVPLLVEGSAAGPASAEADLAIYHLVLDVVTSTATRGGAFVRVAVNGTAGAPTRVVIETPADDADRVRGTTVRSEDRLIALGGRVTISSTTESLTVEGEIPCAS
jgi:signal transduction histidine kinase